MQSKHIQSMYVFKYFKQQLKIDEQKLQGDLEI